MLPWLSTTYSQLTSRAASGALHHGLLLKGVSGVGKRTLTEGLAQYLLCKNPQPLGQCCNQCQSCLLYRSDAHPDLYRIDPEKQIGVDAIREMIQKLSGTAQLSGNKVLLIFAAHQMTESAANALLKTLEEPTGNTYLVLCTDQPHRLLPTILSRCEKISVIPPSVDECKIWLAEQGCSDVGEEFIRLYHHAPLRIQQEWQKSEGLTFEDFVNSMRQLSVGELDPVVIAEKWRDDAERVIPWLTKDIADRIKKQPTQQSLWHSYELCQRANQRVQNASLNRAVLLASVLTSIAGLSNIPRG